MLLRLRHYWRKLWVRVLLMGTLAIVVIGLTQLIETVIPGEMQSRLPGRSADRLLDIIAAAMLAVTTFSLTVMVSVYRASSSQWTPRVHQLIMQDNVTQNTLATFIGAYVYALTGIVLRELGIYDDEKSFVLFWCTVLVLAFLVWSLIRWVLHLQTLGSLIDTTRQVEDITGRQFRDRLQTPCLGARPLVDDPPGHGGLVTSRATGYVQHVHADALHQIAADYGAQVYLLRDVGGFVFLNEPIFRVTGTGDDIDPDLARSLCAQVSIGDVRTYDQDPRFGLLVMSEIGSRALSPGVNDPGTAIDVINRCGRILSDYRDETAGDDDAAFDRLHIRPLHPDDLIEDAFNGVSRDGAATIEVQLRLQKVLAGLARHPDEGLADAAGRAARLFRSRALAAMTDPRDRERLEAVAPDPARHP